jgi:hypothetical protein
MSVSLEMLSDSLQHLSGSCGDQRHWFDAGKHAQLTADAYNSFVIEVTEVNSLVVIRAPSYFRDVNAIRTALCRTDLDIKIIGMLFRTLGGVGHWDAVDFRAAQHLLKDPQQAGIIVSSVMDSGR